MLALTTEQILALAPDDASRKAGQGLASANKWVSAGSSTRAVWGECLGSGSKPYQAIADIGSLAFRCSCPSRKFPCKHGVGLLLYYSKDPGQFTETAEPAWVTDWIDKREQKGAASPVKEEAKVVDKAAQLKRSAAREEKVAAGIEELLMWMKDVLHNGLVHLPESGPRFFEDMSKRLVDAQAPGLARCVREIGDVSFFKEGWQTEVLDGFARLYMSASGFQNLANIDPDVVQDLRSFIGFSQGSELLEGRAVINDTWMVIGSRIEAEGSLTVEKHWLAGSEGQTGLFLQYVPYGGRPGINLFAGQAFKGEVSFYPSASPLRVAIRNQTMSNTAPQLSQLDGWSQVVSTESQVLSRTPLMRELPYIVAGLRPAKAGNDTWLIEDRQGVQMRLDSRFADIWKWMALSGGEYLPTAILGAEHTYTPMGVWHHNTYISLS